MAFPYFGQKLALLKWYQRPLCDIICEPFAGSARYSVKYGLDRMVYLNDLYPVVYNIWKWIQSATKADINGLPNLKKKGQSLADIKSLSDVERDLLGFATGVGRAQPCDKISAFGAHRDGTVQLKKGLLRLCGRIKHWQITNVSYSELRNIRATWFIDPPYQKFGHHYKHNEEGINFTHLGNWCKERMGQVIVCEAGDVSWLPFRRLKSNIKRLQRKDDYYEVVYYQSDVSTADLGVGFGLETRQ